MDKIFEVFGAVVVMAVMLFIVALLGTLLGAGAGWAVGMVFGQTFAIALAHVGIADMQLWQVGAVLGFVSVFFSRHVRVRD